MAKKKEKSKDYFQGVFPKVEDKGKTSLKETADILYPKGKKGKK